VSQKNAVRKPPLLPQLLSRRWGTNTGSMLSSRMKGWSRRGRHSGKWRGGEAGSRQPTEKRLVQSPKEPHLGVSVDTALHFGGDPNRGS